MPPPTPQKQYAFTSNGARIQSPNTPTYSYYNNNGDYNNNNTRLPPSAQRRSGNNNNNNNTAHPPPFGQAPTGRGYGPTTVTAAGAAAPLLPQHGRVPSAGYRNGSDESHKSNPFNAQQESSGHSISSKFALSPDPSRWGTEISDGYREPDDLIHNPDPHGKDDNGSIWTLRGLANLGCIFILGLGLITLFAGYPIMSHFLKNRLTNLGGFNLGGINATGQVMEGRYALIDPDTPEDAYTYRSAEDGEMWDLVFSDEFETEGRSFYPGDDPFWEAVDLHYWGTNNLEWYDPKQLTTENGALKITLDDEVSHRRNYTGGLMTTWNKFCFTGGILLCRVILPGRSDVYGLWPAVWAMGNLGRAGYGASLDGMWPYTYEACDVGTLSNQTNPFTGEPEAARTAGDENFDFSLSYLPGQRLSACTCPGEMHPGPVNPDGTFVGRSAPEIDVIEAQVGVSDRIGHVSQSSQWAPFNAFYSWFNETNLEIYQDDAYLNTYKGSVYQQASSVIAITDQDCYELNTGCYSIYGFEYKPGYQEDGAYITWINDGTPSWRLDAGGMAADPIAMIDARPVPKEPMYIIMNLGISPNFGEIDFENLVWPANMYVDWVRVYQHPDRINIGCDPPGFPTNNYINAYPEAYSNPNLTTWVDDYQQPLVKNRLIDEC